MGITFRKTAPKDYSYYLYKNKDLKYLPYIIGHSAFESKLDIDKCYDSGMDDFLAKPSATGEYYNKISRWLAEPFRLVN